jgi:pimeloyl-ACP methyl ester carboxylesterase
MKTGLSGQVTDALEKQIKDAQAAGQKVVLIGHSMGGTIAANTALKLADRGVKVDGLVLLGGAVRTAVIDAVKAKGIKYSAVVNPDDTVPKWSATYSLWNAMRLFFAAADAEHHQGPGYFSEGANLDRTIKGIQAI